MQEKVYQNNRKNVIISNDWITSIKLDGTESLALELGCSFPLSCPACNQEPLRSKGANFPIQLMTGGGWYCYACKISGDAINFASWFFFGSSNPSSSEEWKQLREHLGSNVLPFRTYVQSPAPRPLQRPPLEEVLEVFDLCVEVESDPQVSEQLVARRLNPQVITERNLARVLPKGIPLPSWCAGWSYRHRLIIPLYNSSGEVESCHGRDIRMITEAPKGLFPTGFSSSGLVMADSLGLLLLRGETPGWFTNECNKVQILEGVPDFLKYACKYTDLTSSPAIFSIFSGAWTQAAADKIPYNTMVAINPHNDESGKKYADHIRGTLKQCRTTTNLIKNK